MLGNASSGRIMNAHAWKTSKQHRTKSLTQKALVCDKGRTKEAAAWLYSPHPHPHSGNAPEEWLKVSPAVHLSKTDQQAQCTLIYGLQTHSSK